MVHDQIGRLITKNSLAVLTKPLIRVRSLSLRVFLKDKFPGPWRRLFDSRWTLLYTIQTGTTVRRMYNLNCPAQHVTFKALPTSANHIRLTMKKKHTKMGNFGYDTLPKER
jgi:hypothetical protein